MRIMPLVFTFLTIAVISLSLWLIDKFSPYLPETINSVFLLIIAVLTFALGFLVFIGGYYGVFRFESKKGFSIFDRFMDGKNGKLLGEILVASSQDKDYEVFYKKPYTRPPSLRIWQQSSTGNCKIIEQRSDGFKISGHDVYNRVWWEAKGEFANMSSTYNTSLFSYSIFGLPNKKYTYDIFVLMPFALNLKPIYDDHIKKVSKALNLTIARADDFFSQDSIMHEVWSAITQASILVADCTGKNPNVFYEIGIAHTIGKPVILITQNQDDVPFDLRHRRYILYEYTPPGMVKFENTLASTISEIMKDVNTGK